MGRGYVRKTNFRRPNYKEGFEVISYEEYIQRCLTCKQPDCEPKSYDCNLYGYLDTGNNEITKNVAPGKKGVKRESTGVIQENQDETGYSGEYRVGT